MGSKKRPILVLWLDGNDIVAAVVTSANPRTQTDVPLNDWATSALKVASTVHLSRLGCLEKSLLIARIGGISDADAFQVKKIWDLSSPWAEIGSFSKISIIRGTFLLTFLGKFSNSLRKVLVGETVQVGIVRSMHSGFV